MKLFVFVLRFGFRKHFFTKLNQTQTQMQQQLKFKNLTGRATLPKRATPESAGLDLYSAVNITIPGRGQATVDTDLSVALNPETYGRIAPRSGLALKKKILVNGGVIDKDYRGEIRVILVNLGDEDVEIKEKEAIAQFIEERIAFSEPVWADELGDTQRGANGFGSTDSKTICSPKKRKSSEMEEEEESEASEPSKKHKEEGAEAEAEAEAEPPVEASPKEAQAKKEEATAANDTAETAVVSE